MICPHCARSGVPENARFCPFCTEPIGSPPEGGEPTPGTAPDARSGVADSDERPLVAATHFADFELRAWSQEGGSVQVLVHNSPAGDMRRPVEVPVDRGRLRDIRSLVDTIWGKGSVDIRHSIVDAGRYLSQLLLPTPVFGLLARSQEQVAPDGLRIRLCLDSMLVDLPWEFLYWPDLTDEDSLAGFLVLNHRISLVREAATLSTLPAHTPGARQRMLFAAAHNWVREGVDQWRTDDAYRRLSQALESDRDLLSLDHITASDERISEALRESSAMFHYVGHTDVEGDRGYLVGDIHHRPGTGPEYERLSSEKLAALLQKAGTRLAVFSACNSGLWPFVEPLLRSGLPALVGTQGRISVRSAYAFCQKLYSSLAIGLSLDEAVTWARLHVLEQGISSFAEGFEWAVFMVYMPSTESVLFPQPAERESQQRQVDARLERQQTIYNVVQIIGSVEGGTVVGVGAYHHDD